MYDLLRYAYEDLKSMDNVKIEKMKRDSRILKLENEKQQLISFLKDNIKESKKPAYNNDLSNYEFGKEMAFEEVLAFVNKGGKE